MGKTFAKGRPKAGAHANLAIVGQFPPPINGSNLMTTALVQALESDGMIVHLVDKRFSKTSQDVGQTTPRKMFQIPSLWWRTLRVISKNPLHGVIYFTSSRPGAFLIDFVCAQIARRNGTPLVCYLHTSDYAALAGRNRVFRALVKRLFNVSKFVVALSEELASDISGLVDTSKIRIIPNSVQKPAECLRSESEEDVVLYLSNISQDKGIRDFLRVACNVHSADPYVKFLIVGGTSDQEAATFAEAFVREQNLPIQIVGSVDHDTKWEILRQSKILIYPSHKDAQPLTLIEALSLGVPSVAYRVGGIPSIIEDGVTGNLCELGDETSMTNHVIRLLSDKNRHQEYSVESRIKFAREFSEDAFRRNWSRLVSELAQKSK